MFFDGGGWVDDLDTLAREERDESGPEAFRPQYGELGRVGGHRVPPRPAQVRQREFVAAAHREQRRLEREERRRNPMLRVDSKGRVRPVPMPWWRRSLLIVVAFVLLCGVVGGVERAGAKPVRWSVSVASVYDSSPPTASTRHAVFMVAHKGLRFGTRVRFCYRRCVTAVVLDRGPYVAGREWDLNFAVMRAIRAPYGVFPVRWRVV